MAKSRPSRRPSKSASLLHSTQSPRKPKSKPPPSPSTLLAEASNHLIQSQPSLALPLAQRALNILQTLSPEPSTTASLPALNLLAQIYLELGDADAARDYFLQCATLDPEGSTPEASGGGAEKFLWLAQLSPEGGQDSVAWFERGCAVLRRDISALESSLQTGTTTIAPLPQQEQQRELFNDRRQKLACALCGIVEIWMTDLSFRSEAEAQCEALVTEALLVAPDSPEPLQTLASVRISQVRIPEARAALARSLSLWQGAPPEQQQDDERVPDFPVRISLARLCIEVRMLEEAMAVLERLVAQDDQSVEAWYLGGWCLWLLGEKGGEVGEEGKEGGKMRNEEGDGEGGAWEGKEEGEGQGFEEQAGWRQVLHSSRQWLKMSLELCERLEYEDERLREHALELVSDLDGKLGEADEDEEDEVEDEWVDEDQDDYDGDKEMVEA